MNKRVFVPFVVVVLPAIYLLLVGVGDLPFKARIDVDSENRISAGPMSRIDPPGLLPEFAFVDDQGRELSLEDFRGKLLLFKYMGNLVPPLS